MLKLLKSLLYLYSHNITQILQNLKIALQLVGVVRLKPLSEMCKHIGPTLLYLP